MIDVDWKNAFLPIERDSIREVVDEVLPEPAAWTRWCHAAPRRVVLPSGGKLRIDRGAEQGDPLGPIYCAVVLARVAASAREALAEAGIYIFDVWCLNDGQIVCRPKHVDAVLWAFDEAGGRVGAMPARGSEAKTVVRIVGPFDAVIACGGWASEYVLGRFVCSVLPSHSGRC